MKTLLFIAMFAFSMLAGAAEIEAGFSPGGSAENLVVRVIHSARQEILVAAYSFTHKEIASSLVDAHRRGVAVKVVVDSSQLGERYTSATFLANAGIPVRVDRDHAIMHNKYLVIDGATVSTGSFNFTTSAGKRNAENVIVVWNNPPFAHQYSTDWLRHWVHSSAYPARHSLRATENEAQASSTPIWPGYSAEQVLSRFPAAVRLLATQTESDVTRLRQDRVRERDWDIQSQHIDSLHTID